MFEKGLIFTYLMTYGGALVALFNPYIGLLIYVCFAIIRPEALWWWSVPVGNYSRIVAVALLIGWALRGFGRWQFGRGWAVVLLLVGYWLWAILSNLQAPDRPIPNIPPWDFVEALAKIVLPFLVAMTLIDTVPKLRQLAWVICLSQGYVAFEFNMSYVFSRFNTVTEVGFASLDNNGIAITMVTGIGLAFFLGLHTEKWWRKALAFFAAACMAHVVLFSFSRGGMVALIITGFVTFILIPKRPSYYFVAILAACMVAYLAGPQVRERFMTSFAGSEERDRSAGSRLELWSQAWDAALNRPFFGAGPDQWYYVATEYGWKAGKEVHSLWFQLAAELGFPGVSCLLLFYALCCWRLWKFTRERQEVTDPWFRYFARMVIASIVGFAISAQFVTSEGLELPYYITLIGAGVLKLSSMPKEELNFLDLPHYIQPEAIVHTVSRAEAQTVPPLP